MSTAIVKNVRIRVTIYSPVSSGHVILISICVNLSSVLPHSDITYNYTLYNKDFSVRMPHCNWSIAAHLAN